DIPSSSVAQLPNNALGAWMAAKQPNLWQWSPASDQVAVLAAGLPNFATAIQRVRPTGAVAGGATAGPDLAMDQSGSGWLVTACDGTKATSMFWEILLGKMRP